MSARKWETRPFRDGREASICGAGQVQNGGEERGQGRRGRGEGTSWLRTGQGECGVDWGDAGRLEGLGKMAEAGAYRDARLCRRTDGRRSSRPLSPATLWLLGRCWRRAPTWRRGIRWASRAPAPSVHLAHSRTCRIPMAAVRGVYRYVCLSCFVSSTAKA